MPQPRWSRPAAETIGHAINTIHPTAIIGADVVLGTGNTIGAHVVIQGAVVIGDDNWIGTGVVIGAPPEVRSWLHSADGSAAALGGGVVIGSRNVLREYAQVHQGWKGRTSLGDDIFVMNQVYVAHDCAIGDGATLASSVLLAGHVAIGDGANLGLGTSVHQRSIIGGGAMVGMGSVVVRNLPPFSKVYGNPARVRGANTVGMERQGIAEDQSRAVSGLYTSGETVTRVAIAALDLSSQKLSGIFDAWFDRVDQA